MESRHMTTYVSLNLKRADLRVCKYSSRSYIYIYMCMFIYTYTYLLVCMPTRSSPPCASSPVGVEQREWKNSVAMRYTVMQSFAI